MLLRAQMARILMESDVKTTDRNESLSETTSERVKALIRLDILLGTLAAGSRIKLQELTERYEISSIPIREAVRELAGEGLLELQAHKGAIIRGVDVRFVRNMYDIRSAIEQMLVAQAIERLSDVDIARVRESAESYNIASRSMDVKQMLASNALLHRTINAAADNPEALRILEQGWELVLALRFRFGFGAARVATIIEEHNALLDAIERRSKVDAVTTTRRHCESACQDLVTQMKKAGLQ